MKIPPLKLSVSIQFAFLIAGIFTFLLTSEQIKDHTGAYLVGMFLGISIGIGTANTLALLKAERTTP